MFRHCKNVYPIIRMVVKTAIPEANRRSFFSYHRRPGFGSMIRDFEKQMERLERDIFSPFHRFVPVRGSEIAGTTYRLNIDVQGFNPEEIKVSLNNNVLTIQAKMERTSKDGEKYSQEIHRELAVPGTIDASSLKSFLGADGILTLEAQYKESDVKEIPISQESTRKA